MKKLILTIAATAIAAVAYAQADSLCILNIQASPVGATVFIDEVPVRKSPCEVCVTPGYHDIRIEKDGWSPADTTIFLRDMMAGETIVIRRTLKQLFGTLSLTINGSLAPTVTLNGSPVDMFPPREGRFSAPGPIVYGSLYEGGLIPLIPGKYILSVSAPGHAERSYNVNMPSGGALHMDVALDPIPASLSVRDGGNAKGAMMLMDGEEVGIVPFKGMSVAPGRHRLTFIKDGRVDESMDILVRDYADTTISVSMGRCADYRFISEEEGVKIFIDNILVGQTPMDYSLMEGKHILKAVKGGFKTIEYTLYTDLEGKKHIVYLNMRHTQPIRITADEKDLVMKVWQGNNVYADGMRMPATIALPPSDRPYSLKLTRTDGSTAFKGTMSVHSEGKRTHRVLTWSRRNFSFFGADVNLWSNLRPMALGWKADDVSGLQDLGCIRYGSVQAGKVKLLPGLSTSILNIAAFGPTSRSSMYVPYRGEAAVGSTPIVPAFSCFLVNGEFRIGGDISKHVDASVLGTYSWYPDILRDYISLSHITGHDIFVGAEITTRTPYVNVNVRAGFRRYMDAKAHLCARGARFEYTTCELDIPDAFSVSVGFTFGGRDSKGANILRVF